MKDPIADALNLTPVVPEKKKNEVVNAEPPRDDQVENDFEYARKNMYDVIEMGHEALSNLMEVANQSQHPRAYEVVANLIKTLAETNKDLLHLTKQKRALQPEVSQETKQVTNNLFVGSTAELQAMLQKKKEERKE